MHTRGRAVALAVSALLALAACTGTNSQPHTARQPAPQPAPDRAANSRPTDPTLQPPAPAIPGATAGGTLRVLSDYGFTTLDPTEAYYTSTVSILSGLLIRSLTQYVYNPDSRSTILVPDLATDLGRPSNHYRTWRFTLRRGIRFENGRPVTAADLAFGIKRSLDRTTFPEGASYSNQYFLDGNTYQGPYRSPGRYRGISVDGRTITIRMSKPSPTCRTGQPSPPSAPSRQAGRATRRRTRTTRGRPVPT